MNTTKNKMHPVEMYRIRQDSIKLHVPCHLCVSAGVIIENCHACNGKGWHNKTFPYWIISKRTTTIERIDKDEHGYRFWTGPSEYFPEENHIVHFTKDEAQKECDLRNKDVNHLIYKSKNESVHHTRKENKNMSKIYKVPIEYTMVGYVKVVANSMDEACGIAEKRQDDIPTNIYKEDEYLNGSYSINREQAESYPDEGEETNLTVGTIIDLDN